MSSFDKNDFWLMPSLKSLIDWIEAKEYKGYDIYDGLKITESRRILKNRILNPVITQFFKKFPINLRSLIKIDETIMPKAIGLFLHSYVLLSSPYGEGERLKGVETFKRNAMYLKDWLLENSLKNYSGACWNFGFNYKFMFDMPTIVISSIVARGLFEYYRLSQDSQVKDVLKSVTDFVLNDLLITENEKGICFSYTPLQRDSCFNANMLGAELLAKVFSITGDTRLLEYSQRAVDFTLAYQYTDGHWDYSIDLKTGKQIYQIDFHQGYILDSLYDFIVYSNVNDEKYLSALRKGAEFYRREQFFDEGRSKWRIPKVWPVDIHNQAQGIITFSKLRALDSEYLDFAMKLARWTILNMQDKQGFFYYQKHKYFTNKIHYMRWSQAWMMLSLSFLLSCQE